MSHHAEHVDPNAWRGGGNKVGAVDAEVGSGYNMLHLFPDELRLVGAGSSKSANEITVYNADATVSDVLSGHKSMVLSVATDGVIIASGAGGGDVKLWKADTLEEVGQRRHGSPVYGLALSGDLLVSGGTDKTAKLWSIAEPASGEDCTATLDEHEGCVFCVDVTSDSEEMGMVIATGSGDNSAKLWSRDGGASLHTLWHPRHVLALRIEGDVLATGCVDGIVRTFSVASGEQTRELLGHRAAVTCVGFATSLHFHRQKAATQDNYAGECHVSLVSGAFDGHLKVWSLTEETSKETEDLEGTKAVECLATVFDDARLNGGLRGVALSPSHGIVAALACGIKGTPGSPKRASRGSERVSVRTRASMESEQSEDVAGELQIWEAAGEETLAFDNGPCPRSKVRLEPVV